MVAGKENVLPAPAFICSCGKCLLPLARPTRIAGPSLGEPNGAEAQILCHYKKCTNTSYKAMKTLRESRAWNATLSPTGWCFIFAAVGLAIRLGYLTDRAIWYDEAITIFFAKSGFSYIWNHFLHGSNPPFAYFFYRSWILLFGESQLSFELVSVLFGAASIFLIGRVAGRMFGERSGYVAAFLLTFSSYHLFISQQIRGYSIAVFFCLLSLDYFFSYAALRRRRDFTGWLIAGFVMMGVHLYTCFLFAVEILAFFVHQSVGHSLAPRSGERVEVRGRTIFIYSAGCIFILAGCVAGIFAAQKLNLFPYYERPQANFADLKLVLQSVFFLSKPLVGMSLALVVFGVFQSLRAKDKRSETMIFLTVWLGVSILVPLIISRFIPSFFYVRYYIFTHVAWILLTAYGIDLIPKPGIRVVVCVVFAFFLSGLVLDYYTESIEKRALKDTFQTVEANFRKGDVIVHENGWTFGPSLFYHKEKLDERFLSEEFGISGMAGHQISPDQIFGFSRVWFFTESPGDFSRIQNDAWLKRASACLTQTDPRDYWQLYDFKSCPQV